MSHSQFQSDADIRAVQRASDKLVAARNDALQRLLRESTENLEVIQQLSLAFIGFLCVLISNEFNFV